MCLIIIVFFIMHHAKFCNPRTTFENTPLWAHINRNIFVLNKSMQRFWNPQITPSGILVMAWFCVVIFRFFVVPFRSCVIIFQKCNENSVLPQFTTKVSLKFANSLYCFWYISLVPFSQTNIKTEHKHFRLVIYLSNILNNIRLFKICC